MPRATGTTGVLERLSALHPRAIDLSLGRVERLLDRLGRPQDRLPPVVHVAGTNGKGSAVAFLRAMLEAAGHAVHVYTSPHLVRFTERVVVASREIGDDALRSLLEECEAVNDGAPITVFEILTAAAFLAFARAPAEVALLETGLGGRLDATNVVSAPAVTAITPVSLDHQSFLGETLAEIAREKAGILKPRVACVLAAQAAEAAAVIRARAAAVGAPLAEEGAAWRVARRKPGGFAYDDDGAHLILPEPGLTGAHQLGNAGLAVACVRRLGIPVPDDAIARGLDGVRWPARMQRLEGGRLAALLPEGWELWLDGGHNPAAAAVLARHLEGWRDRPVFLVFGMLGTKDAAGFLRPLVPLVTSAATVGIAGHDAALSAHEAAALACALGIPAVPAADLSIALRSLPAGTGPARVLVCGSLYLAGQALAENEGGAPADRG